MQMLSLENELKENSYPGRGIVIGKTPNGKHAVTAYFIIGISFNIPSSIKLSNTISAVSMLVSMVFFAMLSPNDSVIESLLLFILTPPYNEHLNVGYHNNF